MRLTTCHFVLQITHANNKPSPRLHEKYSFAVRIHQSGFKKRCTVEQSTVEKCEFYDFACVVGACMSKIVGLLSRNDNCWKLRVTSFPFFNTKTSLGTITDTTTTTTTTTTTSTTTTTIFLLLWPAECCTANAKL